VSCDIIIKFPVEDVDILEVHVGCVEVVALDLAIEGESHWFVIRIFAAMTYPTVTEGFVVIRFEVVFILFDVWRQHDEEGESHSSFLAFGQ
jgi:hypothetical protein